MDNKEIDNDNDNDNDEELDDYEVSTGIELPTLKWDGPSGWRKQAACRGMDTEIFFRRRASYELMRLCKECKVRKTCLEFAIRNDLTSGFYGGVTRKDRKKMTVADIKD